jgi:hypothetical protein
MDFRNTTQDTSLTVEYSLTRSEILQSFLRSMVRCPKLRTKLLLYAIAVGLFMFFFQGILSQAITLASFLSAVLWGAGFLVFIPLWVFVRGKTSKRTLTVSRDGISTQIGRMKARIPWDKVSVVSSTPHFVLILRTNGNGFFVPDRAFERLEDRTHFLTQVGNWIRARTP